MTFSGTDSQKVYRVGSSRIAQSAQTHVRTVGDSYATLLINDVVY